MNILFLEQYSKISGGQLCLLEIIGQLDRREFTPFVAVPEPGQLPEALGAMGIDTFILPVGTYTQGQKTVFDVIKLVTKSILLIPKLVRIIKDRRINLIYANAPRTFLWGTLAAKLAGVPVLWHLHLILTGRKEKKLTRFLLKLGVDHVITVSQAVADSFITSKYRPKKLSIVYNGADLDKFNSGFSPDKFRAEFGLSPGQPAVGIVGQVSPEKGHLTFVNAAAKVSQTFPDARFFVVGGESFSSDSTSFMESLRLRTEDLGLGEKLIFTGSRSDISQVMAGLDVVVSASQVPEACPRVIIEALASGKTVIATKNGAVPEMIDDGVDGLLFPVDDHVRLAQLIEAVFRDAGLRKPLEVKAREKAESSFNVDNYYCDILNILKSFRKGADS